MSGSSIPEIWDSLRHQLQSALTAHVRGAESGGHYYKDGRWRTQELGLEALERGVIEPGEHPKHFLTDLGWKLGRHGLKLEKEEDGKAEI